MLATSLRRCIPAALSGLSSRQATPVFHYSTCTQAITSAILPGVTGNSRGRILKTIIVSQLKEPERYEALMEAMMDGAGIEGGHIMQYTEYTEGGEAFGKFLLRSDEESVAD